MVIITEVRTFIGGLLNSTGREPVEVPDDMPINDPIQPSGWVELSNDGNMRVEGWVGNGIVQKL